MSAGVVQQIKQTRHNWWESFKVFCRLKGYKYYKPPPELKYRYPAPGSVGLDVDHNPQLYKMKWKTPFESSVYNIREKYTYPDHKSFDTIASPARGFEEDDPLGEHYKTMPLRDPTSELEKSTVDPNSFLDMDEDDLSALLQEGHEQYAAANDEVNSESHPFHLSYLDEVYNP